MAGRVSCADRLDGADAVGAAEHVDGATRHALLESAVAQRGGEQALIAGQHGDDDIDALAEGGQIAGRLCADGDEPLHQGRDGIVDLDGLAMGETACRPRRSLKKGWLGTAFLI